MQSLVRALVIAICFLFVTNQSSVVGGLVLSIPDVTLTSGGGTQFVDVSVAWVPNVGEDAFVDLDNFFAQFSINQLGPTTSQVSFEEYQDGAITHNGDHQLTDANYLFHDNSLNISLVQHAGVIVSPPSTVFIATDGRFDGMQNVQLMADSRLLVRLELRASGLVTGEDSFVLAMDGGVASLFFDNDQNEISFTASSGMITVTAVPEPASGALAMIAASILLSCRCVRRIRQHADSKLDRT